MPKFTKNDFASPDFLAEIKAVRKEFLGMARDARAISKAMQEAKGFKAYTDNAKKAADATTRFSKSEQKLVKTLIAARNATSEEGKQQAIATEQKRRATKAAREYAQSQLKATKSTNTFGKSIKSFLFKGNLLANLFSNLASFISRQFVQAIKKAFNIIKNFDKATARLASIVGKTRKEIEKLTKQSKILGSTTQFTATQISGLQIELAKLGFTMNEIIAATPGVLSFATATGADLADAAKTAGAAIRIFGLSASETEDAVATLAVATTKSGLTFEHFDTILSTVGPVAKAYGFTLEDVIALTGELASKGFEANKAATATRNILLNLADANGALAKKLGGAATTFDGLIDGLVRANEEGINLAETLELTDKRSVAAFSTFLEGAESARTLRNSISDVNDELQTMVDKQLDTIAGDILLLQSAWEGFIFSIGGDVGPIRFVIQFLTDFTLKVSNLTLVLTKFNKQTRDELSRTFDLLGALTDGQGEHFDEMIKFFDKMSDEQLAIRGIEQMAKDFALIRKINLKEGQALAGEYLRRREETAAKEIQLEIDKNNRISAEEAKTQKLRGLAAEEAAKKAAKAAERIPEVLTEAAIKFTQEEQAIFDELISDINEQFGILGPMTKEELQLLNDITLDNADFLTEALINKRNEFNDEALENTKDRVDAEIEEEERLIDIIQDIKDHQSELLIQTASNTADILTSFTERRIQELESEKDAGIKSEKEFQEEKNRLLKRAAIINKLAALFDIAINTAVAITKAPAQAGLLGISLIPLLIANGLASAAAVLARPVPKFEKGTKSAPKGVALVGEKGSELLIEPGGHVGLTPGVPTLMDLKQGTRIEPAAVTSQILKYSAIANGFEGKADDGMILMMAEKLDRLERAIKGKPVSSSSQTAAGILTSIYKGNTTIRHLEKYFK